MAQCTTLIAISHNVFQSRKNTQEKVALKTFEIMPCLYLKALPGYSMTSNGFKNKFEITLASTHPAYAIEIYQYVSPNQKPIETVHYNEHRRHISKVCPTVTLRESFIFECTFTLGSDNSVASKPTIVMEFLDVARNRYIQIFELQICYIANQVIIEKVNPPQPKKEVNNAKARTNMGR